MSHNDERLFARLRKQSFPQTASLSRKTETKISGVGDEEKRDEGEDL